MAKRYARLNWQNTPSVATPMNATNLNKMDKGIDDCDNAIEEIYSKRVNNVVTTNEDTFLAGPVGKVLQDQVTELNKNLGALKVLYKSVASTFKLAMPSGGNVIIMVRNISTAEDATGLYAVSQYAGTGTDRFNIRDILTSPKVTITKTATFDGINITTTDVSGMMVNVLILEGNGITLV